MMVEVAHQRLHALVRCMVEQVPVEAAGFRPFGPRRHFLAHEQQFLTGIAPHETVVGAQCRELLPVVARHLRQQRALAMHHFVMGQRQHEIFREGIEQAEGQLVVVVLAIDRVRFRYSSVSCMKPMFHLKPKPRPPVDVGSTPPESG